MHSASVEFPCFAGLYLVATFHFRQVRYFLITILDSVRTRNRKSPKVVPRVDNIVKQKHDTPKLMRGIGYVVDYIINTADSNQRPSKTLMKVQLAHKQSTV